MIKLSEIIKSKEELDLSQVKEFVCTEHEYFYHVRHWLVLPWYRRLSILSKEVKKIDGSDNYEVSFNTIYMITEPNSDKKNIEVLGKHIKELEDKVKELENNKN